MAWTKEKLLARLDELSIVYQTAEHPPLFTVEESQKLRGEIPGAHTKNLFLKCKKGSFWLITALEETQVELKSLHKKLGSGRLSFGNADLLKELLGITPGSVSALCAINDNDRRVTIVLDAELAKHDIINLHPLVNTATTGISYNDLIKFLDACGHPPQIMTLTS
jgi:Ala-tRNA(Pro) deacylase